MKWESEVLLRISQIYPTSKIAGDTGYAIAVYFANKERANVIE
jgi:hypothetical protein